MENNMYERKQKENMPVLAICYDFDRTLSPNDMQAQGYIQEVGYNVDDFWKETNKLSQNNDMDQNLAYMYKMVEKARGKFVFNKSALEEYGSRVKLFPGVEEWFERIRKYGKEHGVIVEHYIISCGLKEMIDGTSVAKSGAFEKIYASSFYYDKDGVALWPAQVINYTNKTQFLFRISKGILNVNDQGVNDSFSSEEIRVPFRNMVYIGDSDTDVPCMKLVNSYGGHSIGVYNAETNDKTRIHKMMRENRIRYYMPADYRDGTELDILLKAIIDKTATNEVLEKIYTKCKNETCEADKLSSEDEKKTLDLIMALENSNSFATTHMLIKDLQQYNNWSDKNKEALFKIACENSQVACILKDNDVKRFYKKLLEDFHEKSQYAEIVSKKL
ncbi:MAG: haloacid dehalogenase-like hydrolase [Clostridia bacterium]|nr:haloacid dehalogenase-like hydrolase [Clostridia bacterium]